MLTKLFLLFKQKKNGQYSILYTTIKYIQTNIYKNQEK